MNSRPPCHMPHAFQFACRTCLLKPTAHRCAYPPATHRPTCKLTQLSNCLPTYLPKLCFPSRYLVSLHPDVCLPANPRAHLPIYPFLPTSMLTKRMARSWLQKGLEKVRKSFALKLHGPSLPLEHTQPHRAICQVSCPIQLSHMNNLMLSVCPHACQV